MRHKSVLIRTLGQMIYDAPAIHTGMVSIALIERKLASPSTKPSADHHHTRRRGGEALFALIDNCVSGGDVIALDDVIQHLLTFCQVHYTTPEENVALRKHQSKCSSAAAYRRTGVALVYAPEVFSSKGRKSSTWVDDMRAKYLSTVTSPRSYLDHTTHEMIR